MYANTSAEIRPDLHQLVIEAAMADRFFIAEQLLPPFFSPTATGEYYKIEKGAGQLLASNMGESTLRAPKTGYKQIERTWTKDSFLTVDRGLEEVVDDRDAAFVAPSFDAEELISNLLVRNIRIAQEDRVAKIIQDPNIWGSENPKVNYTEANIETIDVAYDFEERIAQMNARGEMMNTIVMSRKVWNLARRSTKLRMFLFGANGGSQMITKDLLANALSESLGGEINILIGETTYSTAKRDKSVSDVNLASVWKNDYIWFGDVRDGEYRNGGAGRTIVWEQTAGSLWVVESYRDESKRSDIIRVRQDSVEKVVNPSAGILLKTNFA